MFLLWFISMVEIPILSKTCIQQHCSTTFYKIELNNRTTKTVLFFFSPVLYFYISPTISVEICKFCDLLYLMHYQKIWYSVAQLIQDRMHCSRTLPRSGCVQQAYNFRVGSSQYTILLLLFANSSKHEFARRRNIAMNHNNEQRSG